MAKKYLRICRHCGQFFAVGRLQHLRCVCYDPVCKEKETDRINRLKRFYRNLNKNKLRLAREKKKQGPLNEKIDKICMNCGKGYKDYGPYNRGLCPACKQLEVYGETDWGTI